MKKLYKVWQSVNSGYDTYDSFVCCAESTEEARAMNPADTNDTDYTGRCWTNDLSEVNVVEIGTANDGVEKGLIVESFNAG